jgi:hypothetical protein
VEEGRLVDLGSDGWMMLKRILDLYFCIPFALLDLAFIVPYACVDIKIHTYSNVFIVNVLFLNVC